MQSIREKSFYGEEASTFAKLYFQRDDLTLMLPENDLDETVREPISSKDARKLLDDLKAWKGKPSKQWKTRARANQAAIDCGDPFEYSKVYKALCLLESENALRAQDRAHLTQSTNLLVDELAHSLKKSPDQARKLLSKATG